MYNIKERKKYAKLKVSTSASLTTVDEQEPILISRTNKDHEESITVRPIQKYSKRRRKCKDEKDVCSTNATTFTWIRLS